MVAVSGASPLEIETLKALKQKRHRTALTSGTLAEQLGIDVTEFDAAISGQAVSAAAASRLQTWATA